jgi:hypothetical protein
LKSGLFEKAKKTAVVKTLAISSNNLSDDNWSLILTRHDSKQYQAGSLALSARAV